MIKTLSKVGIEGNFLTLKKNIYIIPTINIILNGEKLDTFPPSLGTRKRCLLSPLLFNTIMEVLVTPEEQEKEIKELQIAKEEIKLSDFCS